MRIFVSYRSTERDIVTGLVNDLEDMGHEVWYDQVQTGGQVWWDGILEEIRSADLFLFAFSTDWLESIACQREFQYAIDLSRNLLPVQIKSADTKSIPESIQRLQIIDYRSSNNQRFRQLVRSINAMPSSQPLPDPLPSSPPAPISDLLQLAEKLTQTVLSSDVQVSILQELRNAIENNIEVEYARGLLIRLVEHRGVLAWVASEAQRELTSLPPAQPDFHLETGDSLTRIYPGNVAALQIIHEVSLPLVDRQLESTHGTRLFGSNSWSPDGSFLAFSLKRDLYFYDVAEKQPVKKIPKCSPIDVAWSVDGKHILAYQTNSKKYWIDVYNLDQIANPLVLTNGDQNSKLQPYQRIVIDIRVLKQISVDLQKARMRLNGKRLLIPGRLEDKSNVLVCYNIDQQAYTIWETNEAFIRCAFGDISPDGRSFIVIQNLKKKIGYDSYENHVGKVELWSAESGRKIVTFAGQHQRAITLVSFSPKGDQFATAGEDRTIKIWSVLKCRVIGVIQVPHLSEIYWSSDGALLCGMTYTNDLCVWDVARLQLLNTFPDAGKALSFSPNGALLAGLYKFENSHYQYRSNELRFWGV